MNTAADWIERTARETGLTIEAIAANPLVRRLGNAVGLGNVLGAVDRVNVAEIQAEVDRYRREHPQDTPSQLARRIVADKALWSGGIGVASAVLPGVLATLLALDLAANLLLQAQMAYQVAAVYGLDLQAPERKGEVVLIFAVAYGGSHLMQLGFGLVGRLPIIAPVVGGSTNAAAVWLVGNIACQVYEARSRAAATAA